MLKQVVLVPLLPLAGAVILLLFSKRLAKVAGYVATVLVAGSFVVSLTILSGLASQPSDERLVVRHLFGWMVAGNFRASVDFRID
ncbi:MAG TPA: NADH-quinone oxidoreductase subunit L, partial [Actinomycetota bacterium]